MTMAWFRRAPGGHGPARRGGAPVGVIAELPDVELGAVLLLRLWCEGDGGRAQIARDFLLCFETGRAAAEFENLDRLVRVVVQGGRRPLMRHGINCTCFGGDESAFAHMVAAAAAGDREEAMAFALALMSPDAAFAAVQMAESTGLAIHSLAAAARRYPGPEDRPFIRH